MWDEIECGRKSGSTTKQHAHKKSNISDEAWEKINDFMGQLGWDFDVSPALKAKAEAAGDFPSKLMAGLKEAECAADFKVFLFFVALFEAYSKKVVTK